MMAGMKPSTAQGVVLSATFVVVVHAATLAFALSTGATDESGWTLLFPLATVACLVGGWIVVGKAPTSPVGPALAWTGGAVTLTLLIELWAASNHGPHPLPGSDLVAPLWAGIWPLQLAGFLWLLLTFPDGRSDSRFARLLPWVFGMATVAVVIGLWGGTRLPDGNTDPPPTGFDVVLVFAGTAAIGFTMLAAVVTSINRYRSGTDQVRHQMRWLLLAGVAVVTLLLGGWTAQALGGSVTVAYTPFVVAIVTLIPLAVTIAVVRHDLYDIDRLLSDSAALLLTTLLAAGVFAAVVTVVGTALHDWTVLGTAAAAFVTAIALLPAHRYINRFVGRLVDRDRYVAAAAVEAFTADVRASRREPEEIEEVLRQAQEDPGLRVLLASPDDANGWVDLHGSPAHPTPDQGLNLEARGVVIGRIELTRLSARSRRRAAELAQLAWVPIEVSRLRLALHGALEDVRAGSARLAEATTAERRRLERDLHDGAQQHLVAIGMRLRSMQRGLPDEPSAEIDRAVTELETTVAELRHLAQGIRPSRLDDGLPAALDSMGSTVPLPFDLLLNGLPPLDETRSLTAYLVVSEAVANILKHAQATRIRVTLGQDGESLTLLIEDDGVGVPDDVDIRSLRDRVQSIGGILDIVNNRDGGTTIRAVL